MDAAINYGYLDVVKYLHSVGKDCTIDTLGYRQSFDHQEVINYLRSIGKDFKTDDAIMM